MYRIPRSPAPVRSAARHAATRRAVPARRTAAVGAAVALAAGAAAFAPAGPAAQAAPAPATAYSGGTSAASVLRADLDVSLAARTVDVPVHASLNDVRAPGDARETALTVAVGHGVEAGRPVDLLRARVATATATVDGDTAEGYADLADARIHLPGLPLLSLVSLDAVTSRATCRAGHTPTAYSHLVGVTVLGQHVSLHAVGTTTVDVPGVGRVNLALTRTATTSRTAAATALRLAIHVDPLSLGVADVSGEVTIARATCRTPQPAGGTSGGSTSGGSGGSGSGGNGGGSTSGGGGNGGGTNGGGTNGGSSGGGGGNGGSSGAGGTNGGSAGGSSASGGSGSSGSAATGGGSAGGSGARPQTTGTGGNLAETGAGSGTPYLAAGAVALAAAGGAAVLLAGRRRRNRGTGA